MELSVRTAAAIITVIITLAGIFVPIIWDDYTHKTALELRVESSTALLPEDPLLKDLHITYQDKPIRDLTRMDLIFINTGNVPITSEDIIVNPKVRLPHDSEPIAAIVLNTDPQDLYVQLPLDDDSHGVDIKFDLMNPGDFVKFAVYMNGSSGKMPIITSRIKGLKNIAVINNIRDKVNTETKDNWSWNWLGYLGLCLVILFILEMGREAIIFRRARDNVRKNPDLLNKFENINDFKKFVDKELVALSQKQKKNFIMNDLQNAEKDFSPENKKKLINAINLTLEKTNDAENALMVFSFILIAVLFYYNWDSLKYLIFNRF
jgi:hypothetical protein